MTIESGRTIAGKLDKPKSDSERTRAKKYYQRKKLTAAAIVVILGGFLVFMTVRAGKEFFEFIARKDEVETKELSPSVEVIDEGTGTSAKMSSRMREFIANFETELSKHDLKLAQARIPIGKIREVDFTLEEFQGVFKVSVDRGIGVQAEDIARMIRYLREEEEIDEVEYVDVRVNRKAYWKV